MDIEYRLLDHLDRSMLLGVWHEGLVRDLLWL